MLNKEQILKAEDLKYEVVNVPEWNGEVKVRSLTGTERDEFESSLFEAKGADVKRNMANMRAKLLALCMVGANNERLFSSKDIEALGGKSAKALDRIFSIAQKLNGIGAQEIDELTKN